MSWQKKNRALFRKVSFVAFLNIFVLFIILFAVIGSLFLEVKMINYRFDIKKLTSHSVILEQKNAELKNQSAVLQNFNKFASVIQNENLILVTTPAYFSLTKKASTEVGIKNLNNL